MKSQARTRHHRRGRCGVYASPRPRPSPIRSRPTPDRLSGVTLPSGVRAFKGIPFGAPPVGELRWKEPQPVAKWDGVRKAEQFGNVCVQPSQPNRMPNNVTVDLPDSPKMSEDCLYLNVWTSANRASDRRPVMVWIFGGAYTEGGGFEPAQRRREPREEGRRARHVQLPPRRVRLLLAPRADEGVGPQRVGQPGAGRHDRGAAVGEDEHRGLRRRPEQRHDLRRVRRRGHGRRAGRIAGGEGPVPPRDRRERRVDGARPGADDAAGARRAGGQLSLAGRGGRGRGDGPPAGLRRRLRRCRRSPNCARGPPRKWSRRCAAPG